MNKKPAPKSNAIVLPIKEKSKVISLPELASQLAGSPEELLKEEIIEEIIPTYEPQPIILNPIVEKIPNIYHKYRKFIVMANSGFLRGCEYPQLMEILRHTEKCTGHQMGLNMQCPACLIDLVKMFGRTEKK